jgi:ATP-binding cassette, subfamily B, multidrug efflux pump
MKHLSYLNKYLWKYRSRLFLGVLFVVISNYFNVLSPQVIRYSFDLVQENIAYYQMFDGFDLQENFRTVFSAGLLFTGILVLLLAILKGVFMFFMRQTIIVMSRLIEYDLKNELYAQYQELDLGFYKRNNTGDMMSRISEDVSRVRDYLGPAFMYGINLLVLFVMVIYAMLNVSPTLTLWVLTPLPFLSISIYYINTIINKRSEKIQEQLSFLTTNAQETYSGIRVIKSFVQEKQMHRFFERESDHYKETSLRLARVEAFFFPLMLLLIGISTILTIYVGGQGVINGSLTPGNVAEFVIYVNMLTWPVTAIGWVASMTQRAAASQKRINAFLQIKPTIANPTEEPLDLKGNIEFRNVSFTYPDTGIVALKDVSFTLKSGEKMAIVGRTGTGKTTIADLLVRMYDTTTGQILVDGKPLTEVNLGGIRSQIGYVPQDIFLFSDTVAENIAFGTANFERNKIEEAALNAAIHDDIAALPLGYETLVGERGVTLSGGQKQRISIARAFVKDPRILVLDDCLSAVDARTEKLILKNLKTILEAKTAIIITHRISSLLEFDKIIVLDEGRIAETGTHESLMAAKGLYCEMFERQQQEETVVN